MKLFLYLSDFIVPLMIFGIICYGITMKIPVYDTFVKGAKDGFLTVIKIMPTMVGLMVAVGVLRASGFLEFLAQMIGQRVRDRFLSGTCGIHQHVLHRNNILHYERLLHDRKSNKNKIHTARSITGNTRRIGGQRSTRGRSKIEKLR